MQKEELIKELNKYNLIKSNLVNIKELINENIKKIVVINNNLDKDCNFISLDIELRKKLINNDNQVSTMIKKVEEKIKNITIQLNNVQ